MDLRKKVTISWSGGKDSALALYKILLSGDFEVTGLHTVINHDTKRVGMHGVHEKLIEEQAEAIGLPLTKLYLESSESHDAYKRLMEGYYQQCVKDSIRGIVFGDIFLEDLKVFRKDLLKTSGLQSFYPLWKIDTRILLEDFINSGFKTLICAASSQFFYAERMGKTIDKNFINTLPFEVDPCGENGEFHTFVYEGPIFKTSVAFRLGEIVRKTYSYQKINQDGITEKTENVFLFQDLLPLTAL